MFGTWDIELILCSIFPYHAVGRRFVVRKLRGNICENISLMNVKMKQDDRFNDNWVYLI
jgi:hypothetical protein